MATANSCSRAAKKDSDGATPFDNQRLLSQITFPETCLLLIPTAIQSWTKRASKKR